MRKALLVMAGAMLALGLLSVSATAAPKVKTFATSGATVEVDDGTYTITLATGADSGGLSQGKAQGGKSLSDVLFSFISRGDVAGGAPRFSIPIDDPSTTQKLDGYAFLDAAGCGGVSGDDTTVSTELGECAVNFNSTTDYDNWAAFAEANPTFRLAAGYTPFIIADGTAGEYIVSDVVLR